MRTAMNLAGEKLAPSTMFAPTFPSKREARQEFASIIREFDNGEIANDADVSKETVKCWKAARALPRSDNLIKLAKKNRSVMAWTLRHLGVNQVPEFLSPQVMTAMVAAFHQVAQQPGPDGDAIRAARKGES